MQNYVNQGVCTHRGDEESEGKEAECAVMEQAEEESVDMQMN